MTGGILNPTPTPTSLLGMYVIIPTGDVCRVGQIVRSIEGHHLIRIKSPSPTAPACSQLICNELLCGEDVYWFDNIEELEAWMDYEPENNVRVVNLRKD